MIGEGAAIVDIGGESTRPGASPADLDEELSRVIPVIESLRGESAVFISVDTSKPGVMSAAVAAGAAPFGLERPTLAVGSEANVALCDLAAEWTVGEDGYESRSRNSWCAGRTLTGRVMVTVAAGQVAFRLRSFSLEVAS